MPTGSGPLGPREFQLEVDWATGTFKLKVRVTKICQWIRSRSPRADLARPGVVVFKLLFDSESEIEHHLYLNFKLEFNLL